jgi:hypothetical protein
MKKESKMNRRTTCNHIALCSVALMASVASAAPPVDLSTLVPLNSLGSEKYDGFVGGLYPNGKNEPSKQIAADLKRASLQIRPLDAAGNSSTAGKIVVAGIGASVCRQIFAQLEKVPSTVDRSPPVVFVNCALGGQDVNKIADSSERYWTAAKATLANRDLTPAQVQVVWYQSDELRDSRDDFPGRPQRLKESLAQQMQLIKQHFPNARICYHSARHTTAFMPDGEGKSKHAEPRPYHVGWAVKWLLEEQADGRADLAFDGPAAKAPLVAWSTYFWTAGDKPRSDGYRWTPEDVVKDGVHLSSAAQARVADELLAFFATDPYAKMWYLATDSNWTTTPPAPSPIASPAPSAAKKPATPDEAAWIVNGANKLPKLKRLVGNHEFVRAIIRDSDGKIVHEIDDILNRHTDLNQLLGAGQFDLKFVDRDGRQIELTQPVGDKVRLK